MEVIKTINLTKTYEEKENLVYACKDINLTIRQGEFAVITGASGSGKSTLLHLIGGVDSITSGRIIVNGADIATLDEPELAEYRRKKASIIYQFFNLIPSLSVEKKYFVSAFIKKRKTVCKFFR